MMRAFVFLLFALVGCHATTDFKEFAEGNHKFTAAVYKAFAKGETEGNFFFSPISIENTLALAWAGAKNTTAEEITRGLFLPNDRERVYSIFKGIAPLFKANPAYTLTNLNKIFLREGTEILDEYRKTAMEVFGTDVENVDFTKPKEAALKINDWVEKETDKKIHDLISETDIEMYERLILVNAIYFRGKWSEFFRVEDTKKEPFYRSLKDTYDVDTMHISSYFKYFESTRLKAKFLELPYEGEDISMILVLPDEKEGLAGLEARSEEIFSEKNFTDEYVTVSLPKFSMESKVELKTMLKNVGIVAPFEERADFSGISLKDELFISKVFQKSFIDVTEEGTEAAAATFATVNLKHGIQHTGRTMYFMADHPFMFYIFDRRSSSVYFIGRITSP